MDGFRSPRHIENYENLNFKNKKLNNEIFIYSIIFFNYLLFLNFLKNSYHYQFYFYNEKLKNLKFYREILIK